VAALRLGRGVVRLAELHDVDAMLTERGADRRRRVGCTGVDLKLDQAGHLLLRCHSLSFHRAARDPSTRSGIRCSLPQIRHLRTAVVVRARRSDAQTTQVYPKRREGPAEAEPSRATRSSRQSILVTWSNDSSTGVSRSKSETSTVSLPLSGLISLIVPGRPANEPSLIVMVSPTSKSTSAATGRATATPPLAAMDFAVGTSLTSTSALSMLNASSKRSGVGLWALPTKPVT